MLSRTTAAERAIPCQRLVHERRRVGEGRHQRDGDDDGLGEDEAGALEEVESVGEPDARRNDELLRLLEEKGGRQTKSVSGHARRQPLERARHRTRGGAGRRRTTGRGGGGGRRQRRRCPQRATRRRRRSGCREVERGDEEEHRGGVGEELTRGAARKWRGRRDRVRGVALSLVVHAAVGAQPRLEGRHGQHRDDRRRGEQQEGGGEAERARARG